MTRFALYLFAATATMTAACSGKSMLIERPHDKTADTAVTAFWTSEIEQVAESGDWILTRSYTAIADVIGVATIGEDLSHASIYDAKTQTIIEAIDTGVREIPLAQLLQRNHYAIVVRPSKMTAADHAGAIARARSKVGKPYDVRGLVGLDDPEKFYCSELVWWASQTEARTGDHERVITPAGLMNYGEVIYWSGKRDDAQVQAVAAGRAARVATH